MSDRYEKYVRVAVDAPIFDLLDYGVPREYADLVAPGWRVMVPLGRRVVSGFVVDVVERTDLPPERIKPIIDLPDDEPVFTPALLKLCDFAARYYVAPLGEVLAMALPAGVSVGTKQIAFLVGDPERYSDILTPTQQKIISLLREGPLEVARIAQKIGRRGALYHIRKLERLGLVGRRYEYRVQSPPKLVEFALPAPDVDEELVNQLAQRAPRQAAALRYLLSEGSVLASQLRNVFGASAVKALERKGYIRLERRELVRASEGWLTPRRDIKELTSSQRRAVDEIRSALRRGDTKPILLHGITASGKTLVYLEAARAVRSMGRGALFLVPEVALTPQMWGALRSFFGEDVAVLHSYLSPGERADAWRRLRRGEVKIALGARSAIFAPIENLGLIVVDEEHDQSYKQGHTPFYNARDLAVVRGRIENALVILGSATPSMESYYNATTGKYRLIEMTERVPGARLPEVRVVDLTKLRRSERIFSPTAKDEILKRIDRGEQAILLLNRRGYSTSLLCPNCGYAPRCPNCDLTLTYHRVGDKLLCHWCNYEAPAPDACPNCGAEAFIHRGKGTQRLEVELFNLVEPERVHRIDSDAISRKGALRRILEQFASQRGSILVGTQMVAKGHDFPGVTLVVVVDADVGLTFPDFRASEKTFQLLTQVAGRAGRGTEPGLVIIQTRRPNDPAIRYAVSHDYRSFFLETAAHRQLLGYPPFSHLVRIIAQSEDSTAAERCLRVIMRALVEANIPGVTPLAPSKPPISKLKGEFRWHLLIKAKRIQKLLPFLHRVARTKFRGVKLRIDVDPYEMA